MNWIAASLLMFSCSLILYLIIRKSTLLNISIHFINLATFAIPIVLYGFIAFLNHTNLSITLYQFFILVFAALFFSYAGNIVSLKSIEHAPNPGYSLILSKSYVVFTTITSVFLFNSAITWKSALAIALIVGSSALVMIGKSINNKNVQPIWLPLAIIAFFCWGLLALTSKYLYSTHLPVMALLIYMNSIVSFASLIDIKRRKIVFNTITRPQIIILLLIGLFSAGFNYFLQEGIRTAPNIGYVNAINAASISVVSVFSALIFKDELTVKKLFGVVGVTTGIILLVLQ